MFERMFVVCAFGINMYYYLSLDCNNKNNASIIVVLVNLRVPVA